MSIKNRLMELAKHNKTVGRVYRCLGNLFLNVLKIFVATDAKLILFNSFGGKKFDDSPRAIYEKMKTDPRFKNYKLVWAFHNPSDYPEVDIRVKTDGLSYFITALKARCWVSNSSIQRGLVFKGKNTFSFNSWHGTPLKDMTMKNHDENKVMALCDTILAQSKFEVNAFHKCWKLPIEKYKVFGLPRNDKLAHTTSENKKQIRKQLGISDQKLVVLYAPTFRDYLIDNNNNCILDVPIDYTYWEEVLGKDLYFIMRVHYEVAKHNKLPINDIWHDYSDYPSLNDLMIASDILISDYSSIMFDYSILNQPIINYIYDFSEYNEKRGMLFDIREWLPWVSDSRTLADAIKNLNVKDNLNAVSIFREKYVEEYGSATDKSVDYIYECISRG